MYPQYMCILLYVKLILSVMVPPTPIDNISININWSVGMQYTVSSVYVHSAICETYLV